jgi:hypothetical protein
MVTAGYARDLAYAGPGEVTGELGDCPQHLLRSYEGVGDMEMYKEGENSEQEVASHHWGGRTEKGVGSISVGLNIAGHGHADQANRSGIHTCFTRCAPVPVGEMSTHNQAFQVRCPVSVQEISEVTMRLPAWRLLATFELHTTQCKSRGGESNFVLTELSIQN